MHPCQVLVSEQKKGVFISEDKVSVFIGSISAGIGEK